ncbi:hypothetical protein [Pseudomonas putida]|uniref:hypothetical protein n=1 Tax=Pseudomonas putida TaxID=303 RepID=UPI0034A04456
MSMIDPSTAAHVLEAIVLGNQAQIISHSRRLITEQLLNASLLLQVRQGLKKAVLTEVYLESLTVVLAATPPVGVWSSILITAPGPARKITADVTGHISDGLNLDQPGNFHCEFLDRWPRAMWDGKLVVDDWAIQI